MLFVSNNSHYAVECPEQMGAQVRAYVNRTERFVPALEQTFGLPPGPPFGDLKVRFGTQGPCYQKGGVVRLPTSMDLRDPRHLYGGLFHETVHGLLEAYVWFPDGRRHYLPEGGTIVLQVATLERLGKEEAKQWAERYADGWGCTEKQRPILRELVRVYRENGFGAIRAIYAEMGRSVCPTLHKETLVCDLNRILRRYGIKDSIKI